MSDLKIVGIRVITKDWMPEGYALIQNGEEWPDTHSVLLKPDGSIHDLGRPRDLFPPPRWEYPPVKREWFIP